MPSFGTPNLAALAELLRDPSLPPQAEIASVIGADQGFVSHAKKGDLKRITERVDRLWNYVNMRIKNGEVPPFVAAAVDRYLARGGDPALLVRQLGLLEDAQLGFERR